MIVQYTRFDTNFEICRKIFSDICIKIVSKIQFLTFARGVKKKKELSQCDLALSLCCLGRIRTLTGGTRIRRATITPQGNRRASANQPRCWRAFRFCDGKVRRFFAIYQIYFSTTC